jgi:hypothetical protein
LLFTHVAHLLAPAVDYGMEVPLLVVSMLLTEIQSNNSNYKEKYTDDLRYIYFFAKEDETNY